MTTQRIQPTHSNDAKKSPVTYGVDGGVPWIEFQHKNDRWAIYGNCRNNIGRIASEVASRGVKTCAEFTALLLSAA